MVLLILTIVNMRGVHDTGVVFMIPTYLFTGTLLIVIAVGAWHVFASGGHPHPVTPLPALPPPRHGRQSGGCCSRSSLPAAPP